MNIVKKKYKKVYNVKITIKEGFSDRKMTKPKFKVIFEISI